MHLKKYSFHELSEREYFKLRNSLDYSAVKSQSTCTSSHQITQMPSCNQPNGLLLIRLIEINCIFNTIIPIKNNFHRRLILTTKRSWNKNNFVTSTNFFNDILSRKCAILRKQYPDAKL